MLVPGLKLHNVDGLSSTRTKKYVSRYSKIKKKKHYLAHGHGYVWSIPH